MQGIAALHLEPGPPLCLTATLAAPSAALWEVIDGVERYAEVFPAVRRVELLAREGERVTSRMQLALPFPLRSIDEEVEACHRVLGDGRFERRWTTRSRAWRRNTGRWLLTPGGEGETRVLYELDLVPRLPLPGVLVRKLQESASRQLLVAVYRAASRRSRTGGR